jgi:hypothetical protein
MVGGSMLRSSSGLTLKIEAASYFETFIYTYKTGRAHNTEEYDLILTNQFACTINVAPIVKHDTRTIVTA